MSTQTSEDIPITEEKFEKELEEKYDKKGNKKARKADIK